MGSDESHFNVSLIVRDKVARQCPQTTIYEEKGEPKRIRTEVHLLTIHLDQSRDVGSVSYSTSLASVTLSSSMVLYVHFFLPLRFPSTETIRLIRDGGGKTGVGNEGSGPPPCSHSS